MGEERRRRPLDRKTAAMLRRMAEHGGLHVVCLGCGARGRHMPGESKRLRDKQCRRCGCRHPRTLAWIRKNPERAAQEAALAKLGLFDGVRQ